MAALGAALGGYGVVARDWRTGAPIISVYDTNRLLPGGAELLTRGLAPAADPPTLFRACVESNFDTRMVLVLPTTMIGEEMGEVFEKAHLRNFPEHGKVACSKLLIMAHGYWYTFSHGPVGAAIQGTDARFKIELVSEGDVFHSDKPQQQENIDQQSRLPEEPQKKELVLEKENIDQRSCFPEEPQKKVLVLEKGQQENIDQRSRFPEEPQMKELVVEKGQQENIDQLFRLPEDPQKELVLESEEPQQQENINQGRRSGSRLPQETQITSLDGTAIEHNNIIDPMHLENDRELATASAVRKDDPTSKDERQNGMLNQKQMPILSSNEEIGRVVSTSGQELSAHPVAGEEARMINEQAKEKTGPEAAGETSTSEKQEASGADSMLAMLVKPYETRKGKAPAIDLSGQGVNENEAAATSEKQKASGMLVKPSEMTKGKDPEVEQGIKENTMPDAAGKTSSGADTVLEKPFETIKRKAPEAHVEPEKVKKLKVDISDHGKTVEVECQIGVTNASEGIPEQMETKEMNTVDSVNHIEGSVGEEKAVKTNATRSTDEKVKKFKVDISDHGKTVEEVECEIGVINTSEGIPEQMETKEKNTVNSVNHIEGSVGEEKAVKTNATRSTDEKESDSTTISGASTGAMDSEINKNLDDIMDNLMTQHFPPASPSVDRNIPSSTAFGSGESDSESSNDRDDYDEVVKEAGDLKTSEASIEKAAKKDFTEAEMPQERSGEVAKDESKAQKKKLLPANSESTTQESDASIKNRAAPLDGQNPSGGSSSESSEPSESSSADESECTVSEKWKKRTSTVPRSRRNSTAVAPASVPVRNPRRNSIDSRFEHFIENKNGLEELLNLRMQKRVPSPADVANDSPSVDVVLETQEIQGGNTVCKQVGSSEQGSEGKSDREEPKIPKKSKGGEQDKQRLESSVNDKENDLEAKNSIFKECAERYQKIITKEKQDVPVKEIASTENGARMEQKPDKTGKKSRVKRIATRDMIQASTETSDYASSEDVSRKRRKKSGGSSKSKSSNSNLEQKATRSEIKKAETMTATETSNYVGSEDSDLSRKRRKKSEGSSKSKSSKFAQSNSNLEPKATRSETKKAETTKATPSTGKPVKVSGGEISCPGCGKVYARKTSAFYSHKKACTGNS